MIVVADTSPINYLVLIDEIDLLPYLFGRVLLPLAVSQELQNPQTSSKVSNWVANLPSCAEVRALTLPPKPELVLLDPGEREAIQLALELGIDTVLLDDADGCQIAQQLHLEVRGTLGILERGARLGKTDFGKALSRLEQTNFRISPALKDAFLKRNS